MTGEPFLTKINQRTTGDKLRFSRKVQILYKRHHFESEKEYRLWFDDVEFMTKVNDAVIDENTLTPGSLVQISDLERFIQRIVVAPAKSEGFAKLVKSVCGAYNLRWLAAKVERSYIDELHESQLFPDAKRNEDTPRSPIEG